MSLSALPMILGVNINKVQRQGSKLHIMCQSIACLAIYVAFPQFFFPCWRAYPVIIVSIVSTYSINRQAINIFCLNICMVITSLFVFSH